MLKLRSYQNAAIQTIYETFTKKNRQYIEMPTGSGKTITFLSYAAKYHKKILIIVPSAQLLEQIYETCLLFYHKSEISRRGNRHLDEPKRVHIVIINSIRGDYTEKLALQPFDLTIIDEAHHTQSESYKKIIFHLTKCNPNLKILGVTATPDRLDGKLLDDILFYSSFNISIEELINDKFLCDMEGYSVKTNIDISNIDSHNGDFSLAEIYKKLCVDSRNKMILDICKNEMMNLKTLVFCINIEHSKIISKLLNDNDIPAAFIDGDMSIKERTVILKAFRDGEISVLCNCQLLTEGFDEPSINGIVIARPTRSKALFSQMIGRGLRLSPGKSHCKIIDIVDNHKNLAGFNHLLVNETLPESNGFKNMKQLRDHVDKELLKIIDFTIERTNLFLKNDYKGLEATESMFEYLNENQIEYHHFLTFDEGSFLIWFNELKKEFYGNNKRA